MDEWFNHASILMSLAYLTWAWGEILFGLLTKFSSIFTNSVLRPLSTFFKKEQI